MVTAGRVLLSPVFNLVAAICPKPLKMPPNLVTSSRKFVIFICCGVLQPLKGRSELSRGNPDFTSLA
jgi:hypothetical protein